MYRAPTRGQVTLYGLLHRKLGNSGLMLAGALVLSFSAALLALPVKTLVAQENVKPASESRQEETRMPVLRQNEISPAPIFRPGDITVGSEGDRYLRALAVLAPVGEISVTLRPNVTQLRPSYARQARPAISTLHSANDLYGVWSLDTTYRSLRIGATSASMTFNSNRPSLTPDGPAWSGRGVSLRASPSVAINYGRISARIAPTLWWSENRAFPLQPTLGPYPWSDANRWNSMDFPQRYGRGPLARLDPGESEITIDVSPIELALTSASVRIGPGADHALILQGDHGGFPRVEARLPNGISTPIGKFRAQIGWGRSAQTAWTHEDSARAMLTTYTVATYQPRFFDRIEIGLVRVIHRYWRDIASRDFFVPFGAVYRAPWVGGNNSPDNQLASLFARVHVPEAGMEFFGEFGRNDNSRNKRDLLMELEHNAAWLVGAKKVWREGDDRLWSLSATAVSGTVSPIHEFRGQAYFYQHTVITQGHTVRGQLLGTPLLQRDGGGELRLDRWDSRGRFGIVLGTRSLPTELAVSVEPGHLRQEWSAVADWMRWTSYGSITLRAGWVADLGYSGSGQNLHTSISIVKR